MNNPSKPSCCVLFTTDPTYLFPTLVSALQARRHTSQHKADVTIFCLELDQQTAAVFAPLCASVNIGLVAVDAGVVEGQSAMLARLFLDRFVPKHYTDYLYLDGDVHILDSLDPLIDIKLPRGSFLAANDPLTFLIGDRSRLSRQLRMHLSSLGLGEEESLQYFNSGVLRICASGWKQIGQEAWGHYKRIGGPSRFPDQDALNLAGRGHRLPLSLVWNYPVFLRNSRLKTDIQPRVKHFMSSPKPWHGPFPPWTKSDCEPYLDALRTYPQLASFQPIALSSRDRVLYRLQQNGKRLVESVTWGLSKRRDRILDYQATCLSLSRTFEPDLAHQRAHSPSPLTTFVA